MSEQPGPKGRAVLQLARSEVRASILVQDDGSSFVRVVASGGECSWECPQGVIFIALDSYIACAASGVADLALSATHAAVGAGDSVSLWLSGPWRTPGRVPVGRFAGRPLVVDFVPSGGATAMVLPDLPQSWGPDEDEVVVSIPDRDLVASVTSQIRS